MASCADCRYWEREAIWVDRGYCKANVLGGIPQQSAYNGFCTGYKRRKGMSDVYTKSEVDAKIAQHLHECHAEKKQPVPDSIEKIADEMADIASSYAPTDSVRIWLGKYVDRLRALEQKKHKVEVGKTWVTAGDYSVGNLSYTEMAALRTVCGMLGIEIEEK